MGGLLALFDPLLGPLALTVEADDGSIRAGQGGHDEAHPREEFPEVVLDLSDHRPRSVPRRGPGGPRTWVQTALKRLSPRLSPTPRNTTLLAATRRYSGRVPSISQLAEKVNDGVA